MVVNKNLTGVYKGVHRQVRKSCRRYMGAVVISFINRGCIGVIIKLDCRQSGTVPVRLGSQAYQHDGNQDRRHISTIVISFVNYRCISTIIWLDLRLKRRLGYNTRYSGTVII